MLEDLTSTSFAIQTLPSPHAFKKEYPASFQRLAGIDKARAQVAGILEGVDNRLLVIVGPCSIHEETSTKEYAIRLKQLAEEVSDRILIVMRAYFEKPRTCLGWKGMLYDPHLDGSDDIASGLCLSRQLLLALAEMGVPAATEFLDPVSSSYLGDLISWGCIGARTAESPIHRQFASGLPMPVAFKNSTSGNIDVAINGVLSAERPHTFFGIDEHGKMSIIRTQGNHLAHVVLRGGERGPNYDEESIALALNKLASEGLPPRLVIDCSHDNSSRNHEEQKKVFHEVIKQRVKGNSGIRGIAFESHLFAGSQILGEKANLKYAVSVTDPCLDWQATAELIRWAAEVL